MQITDYLSKVVTSTLSQSLGDVDLEPRKSLPPPRGTVPTAMAAATEFPNCGHWKCPSVPVWYGAPVARKGKKSLSNHPAGKAKRASGQNDGCQGGLGFGAELAILQLCDRGPQCLHLSSGDDDTARGVR